MSSKAETVQEMIETWDNGGTISTIKMGGISPGYEQAIQVLMVEVCRVAIEKPRLPEETDDEYVARFKQICDEVAGRFDNSLGGLSGGQVGAASNLAYRFMNDGPAATLAKFEEQCPDQKDREIQVSSYWPRAVPVPQK